MRNLQKVRDMFTAKAGGQGAMGGLKGLMQQRKQAVGGAMPAPSQPMPVLQEAGGSPMPSQTGGQMGQLQQMGGMGGEQMPQDELMRRLRERMGGMSGGMY